MSLGHFEQENLLAVIAHDDSPGGCIQAAELLPANAWDSHYRAFFDKLRAFVERFKTSPREHFLDITEDLCAQKPDSADIYRQIYGSVCETWAGGVNREHVYSRARLFGRAARIRQGIGEALPNLQHITEESVAAAELALDKARKGSVEVMDMGVSTHDTAAFMDAVENPDPPPYPTGIKEFDDVNFGLVRKEMLMLAGAYGTGKSWGLLELAVMAAIMGEAKVLYVPLEMNARRACVRIMQRLFGYGLRNERVDYTQLIRGSDGTIVDLDPDYFDVKSIYDDRHHAELRKQMQGMRRRPEIRVKAWPSGKMSIRKLEAYLEAAEAHDGFVPDAVLLDYIQITEIKSAATKRIELGQNVVDFRGLADERNFAAGTALQINRDGMGTNQATGRHIAEDIAAAHHADRLGIYNQSDIEKAMGLARIGIDKNRNDKGGKMEVLISQCYDVGAYALDSAIITPKYSAMMDAKDRRHGE